MLLSILDCFDFVMFARMFYRCWAAVTVFLFTVVPLAAEEVATEETQEWVVSYALMILFMALALVILLRPVKRSDSTFSHDEMQAQKEESMKKIQGRK